MGTCGGKQQKSLTSTGDINTCSMVCAVLCPKAPSFPPSSFPPSHYSAKGGKLTFGDAVVTGALGTTTAAGSGRVGARTAAGTGVVDGAVEGGADVAASKGEAAEEGVAAPPGAMDRPRSGRLMRLRGPSAIPADSPLMTEVEGASDRAGTVTATTAAAAVVAALAATEGVVVGKGAEAVAAEGAVEEDRRPDSVGSMAAIA